MKLQNDLITPIYSAINNYEALDPSRFHMPGHSGVDIDGNLYRSAFNDITELSFSDQIINPHGIIERSEELAAATYGAKKILYLTSGGTGAVFIAISIINNFGNTIITDRNAHKSVYSAARVRNMNVIQAEADEIIPICENNSNIAGVLVTTPNYFGKVTDFEKLSKYLKARGIIFVIDHCHGAHFVYSKKLPPTCVPLADLVVCSLHKTLPVMTGGAMLAINREDLIHYGIYHRMTLHTTSASYPMLASMDYARAYMEKNGEELYEILFSRIDKIADEIADTRFRVVENDDRTRLVISSGGVSGFALKEDLERLGIFPEMASISKVVFILTPFNGDKLPRLVKALHQIKTDIPFRGEIPKIIHQRAAASGAIEFVRPEDSLGRVAVNEIGLYPPGTPIIISGDIIDQETIDLLIENRNYIFGLVKGMVPVLK